MWHDSNATDPIRVPQLFTRTLAARLVRATLDLEQCTPGTVWSGISAACSPQPGEQIRPQPVFQGQIKSKLWTIDGPVLELPWTGKYICIADTV